MTLDGQLALPRGKSSKYPPWISSRESRAGGSSYEALVGRIAYRNRHNPEATIPSLTDRSGLPRRRPLLRVILDSKLRLPLRSRIVRAAKNDVLVFTAMPANHPRAKLLRNAGHRNGAPRFEERTPAAELARRSEGIGPSRNHKRPAGGGYAALGMGPPGVAGNLFGPNRALQGPPFPGRTRSRLSPSRRSYGEQKAWNENGWRVGRGIFASKPIYASLRKGTRPRRRHARGTDGSKNPAHVHRHHRTPRNIVSLESNPGGGRIRVRAEDLCFQTLSVSASIAVNGCCPHRRRA